MSRRQTKLETMRRKCKAKFHNKQAGLCRECVYLPSGLGAVVEEPGFVVYPSERDSAGLYQSYSRETPRGCPREMRVFPGGFPTLDSIPSDVACGAMDKRVRRAKKKKCQLM